MNALKRPLPVAAADDDVSTFVTARPRMLAAALRTLGDATEAEDVVQDAWLRWQRADRTGIRNPPAFLSTTSKRLALNRALGARTRYETLMDPQMAEPIDLEAGPGSCAERGQKLESALLLLLAKLSAVERAAYLLREAFGCSYRHISQVICSSEANSRQLVTRARKRLAERRPYSSMTLASRAFPQLSCTPFR
jgi:RNA polymerase sigma-70 factor (ECF subfamily)